MRPFAPFLKCRSLDRRWWRLGCLLPVAGALFLLAGSNPADAGSKFQIQKSQITAGGEVHAEGASLTLSGSVGAVDVEFRVLRAGRLAFRPGFWAVAPASKSDHVFRDGFE